MAGSPAGKKLIRQQMARARNLPGTQSVRDTHPTRVSSSTLSRAYREHEREEVPDLLKLIDVLVTHSRLLCESN